MRPGGNGAWLATHGDVVGVDRSADALAFVRARRPDDHVRCAPASTRCPSPTRATTWWSASPCSTPFPTTPAPSPSSARVLRPGGALLLVEPAFAAPRARPRRHRARPPPIPSGRARPRSPSPPASPSPARTYAYSFLAPPAAALGAVDRVRRRPRRPRGLRRRQARARPRVRAAGRPRAQLARRTTTCRSGPRSSCSLPADRDRSAALAEHDQPHPEPGEVPTACGRWRRAGRTPTSRRRGGSGARRTSVNRAPASCSLRTSSTQITPVVCTSVTRSSGRVPDQPEVAVGVADAAARTRTTRSGGTRAR